MTAMTEASKIATKLDETRVKAANHLIYDLSIRYGVSEEVLGEAFAESTARVTLKQLLDTAAGIRKTRATAETVMPGLPSRADVTASLEQGLGISQHNDSLDWCGNVKDLIEGLAQQRLREDILDALQRDSKTKTVHTTATPLSTCAVDIADFPKALLKEFGIFAEWSKLTKLSTVGELIDLMIASAK